MVTRRELERSMLVSFFLIIIIMTVSWGLWATASVYGILEQESILYYALVIVELILIIFVFIFSMVLFGCFVERQGREPGVITIGFAYIPPILLMYALGVLERFLYIFLVLSILAVLYVVFSE